MSTRKPAKNALARVQAYVLAELKKELTDPENGATVAEWEILYRATNCGITPAANKHETYRLNPRPSSLRELTAAARTGDFVSFGAAMLIARELTARAEPLPMPLQSLAVDVASAKLVQPRRPKDYDASHAYVAKVLVSTIHTALFRAEMARIKMTATRNDEPTSGTPPVSACDVVADAMKELDKKPCTYKTVRVVWDKRHRTMKRMHSDYGKHRDD